MKETLNLSWKPKNMSRKKRFRGQIFQNWMSPVLFNFIKYQVDVYHMVQVSRFFRQSPELLTVLPIFWIKKSSPKFLIFWDIFFLLRTRVCLIRFMYPALTFSDFVLSVYFPFVLLPFCLALFSFSYQRSHFLENSILPNICDPFFMLPNFCCYSQDPQ